VFTESQTSCHCVQSLRGLTFLGVRREGYDKDGYDKTGMNKEGFDRCVLSCSHLLKGSPRPLRLLAASQPSAQFKLLLTPLAPALNSWRPQSSALSLRLR
jgi:hypothetical protein